MPLAGLLTNFSECIGEECGCGLWLDECACAVVEEPVDTTVFNVSDSSDI